MAQLTEIDVPVFKELCRVKGNYDQVIEEAMSRDWSGKYIEVQLTIDDTTNWRLATRVRESVSKCAEGEVLIVEVQLAEQQRETGLSTDEISKKPPEEILEEFYRTKYNDAEMVAETELPEFTRNFWRIGSILPQLKLLKLSEWT